MSQYMLFLHTNGENTEMSPDEMQKTIEKYKAWSMEMGAQGKLVGGEKLTEDAGRIVESGIVRDGPFSETKDVIGGFFIVEAGDYAEAEAIAQSCPHHERGLPIEVREVFTMGG